MAIDETGRVLEDLQDPAGRYPYPTTAAETDESLWLGSVKTPALARVSKESLGL